MRTIFNIDSQLQPLKDAIRHKFLPSLTGQSALSDEVRELMSLPVRHGGLDVINPTKNNSHQYQSSKLITAPLVSLILEQLHTYHQEAKEQQIEAKKEATRQRALQDSVAAQELENRVSTDTKRAIQVSSQKGASSWLSTSP